MLIFNCSKAFAQFIEPKPCAGMPPLVQAPPSANPADDGELLRDESGNRPAHIQQWLVHGVRVRRQTCVLAMEEGSRHAMVLTGLKKGDVTSFFNQLIERLANTMAFAATDAGFSADFDTVLAQFMARHGELRFFQRPMRSAQTHLNEVAWQLDYRAAEIGRLPNGHAECANFDALVNDTPRRKATAKDYFFPAEEMLVDWLRSYAGLTPAGEARVREQIKANKRRRFAEQLGGGD